MYAALFPSNNSPNNQQSKSFDATIQQSAQILIQCSMAEARSLVSYELAKESNVLPLHLRKSGSVATLVVAASERFTIEASQTLRFITDCQIEASIFPDAELACARFGAYFGDDALIASKANELSGDSSGSYEPFALSEKVDESEVGQFVLALVRFAVARRASDIHLTPLAEGMALRVRIDGYLLENTLVPTGTSAYKQVARYILVHSELDPNKNIPQDGLLSIHSDFPRIRVSSIPSLHGLAIALRLPLERVSKNISQLNLAPATSDILNSFLVNHRGLCLVVGSTGSGKTTLLYSLANTVVSRGLRLITVEDPVESHLQGALQIEVSETLTIDHALSACLRQDPDMFMVGEIRTRQSASTLINASYNGHGVFASLHSGSIEDALLRLLSLGLDASTCCSAMHSIHAMRLVPTLCLRCKVPHLSASHTAGFNVYQRVGCAHCNYTGYQNRISIIESLLFDNHLRNQLESMAWSRTSLSTALSGRYISGRVQGLELLRSGSIDSETYLHISQS
jgi:type IV pilus assembly protein PilB